MPRTALAERWMAAYGRPPPKGLSRRLLQHAVAYDLQTGARGGLKPALRRALAAAASSSAVSEQLLSPAKKLRAGMRLLREWGGRTHTVEVSDHGFVWEGRRYASLSAIARQITGARWSGPRFFGL